jgi:hypothetical protein
MRSWPANGWPETGWLRADFVIGGHDLRCPFLTAALFLVAVLTVGCDESNSASRQTVVTKAHVPGIGTISGFLRPGTPVRPPARIPPSRRISRAELRAQFKAEREVADRVRPGPDAGPARMIEAVKRSISRRLFIEGAAVACARFPRAAFAAFDHVYTSPALRAEVNNLTSSKAAPDVRQACRRFRLRISDWQGVEVRANRAFAALTGRSEHLEGSTWRGERRIWRLELRQVQRQWKIAIEHAENPDYRD